MRRCLLAGRYRWTMRANGLVAGPAMPVYLMSSDLKPLWTP
jgi:hypothetical protein